MQNHLETTVANFVQFLSIAETANGNLTFNFGDAWNEYEKFHDPCDLECRLTLMVLFLQERCSSTDLGVIFQETVFNPYTAGAGEVQEQEEVAEQQALFMAAQAEAETAARAAAAAAQAAAAARAAAAAAPRAAPHPAPMAQLPESAGDSAGIVHIVDVITGHPVHEVPIVPRGESAAWRYDTMDRVQEEAKTALDSEPPVEEPLAKRRRLDLRGDVPAGICWTCQETEPLTEVRAFQCFDCAGQVTRHDTWTCEPCFKKYHKMLLDGNGAQLQYRKTEAFGDNDNQWILNIKCMFCSSKTLSTWNEMH